MQKYLEVSRILPIFAARLRSWRRALDDGGPVNTGLWVRQPHEQLFLTLNVTLWAQEIQSDSYGNRLTDRHEW